jgi:hypothetical protein
MGESVSHMVLVVALREWAITEFQNKEDATTILCDTPDAGRQRPPKIINFFPDLYAVARNSNFAVGEAKTARDLETKHTQEQMEEFLVFCSNRPGSIFVIAVPWHMINCAKSMIRALKRKHSISDVMVIFLPDLPG